MNTPKIYLVECYRYHTDAKDNLRVLTGGFEDNRDFLTPVMKWTREFYAANMTEAKQKGRAVAKALNLSFTI